MIFVALTALVAAVLGYAYRQLARAYGVRTLLALTGLTVAYFFVKEYLQAHERLVHHSYHVNQVFFHGLLGVPPFVVLGHLFVVVMTWQLAVRTLDRLRLGDHPAIFVALVWQLTAAFAMLMENTGIVGHWWSWNMPPWWWFPRFLGVPLRDLPMDRPITEVWGYFISTFWCALLLADFPRRLTPGSVGLLLLGLAAALEGARHGATNRWTDVVLLLALLSALVPSSGGPSRRLLFPRGAPILRPPGAGQAFGVLVGLGAMCVVCIVQLGVRSKWGDVVSLVPIAAFTLGAFRRWPIWVDGLVAGAVMLAGDAVHDGNTLLAGWLVLRCALMLWLLALVRDWRERGVAPWRSPVFSSSPHAPSR